MWWQHSGSEGCACWHVGLLHMWGETNFLKPKLKNVYNKEEMNVMVEPNFLKTKRKWNIEAKIVKTEMKQISLRRRWSKYISNKIEPNVFEIDMKLSNVLNQNTFEIKK